MTDRATPLGLNAHQAAALLEQRMKEGGAMGNGRLHETRDKVIAGVVSALLLTAIYSVGAWLLDVNDARAAVPKLRADVTEQEQRLRSVETQLLLDKQWKDGVDKRLDLILDETRKPKGKR